MENTKYAVFAGYDYDSRVGGMNNFIGIFDTLPQAEMADNWWDWYQIVDSTTFAIISEKCGNKVSKRG